MPYLIEKVNIIYLIRLYNIIFYYYPTNIPHCIQYESDYNCSR
jgi:hypothetical protein